MRHLCLLGLLLPADGLITPLRPPPRLLVRAPTRPELRVRATTGDRVARFKETVAAKKRSRASFTIRSRQALSTLVRVALPTLFATVFGFLYFDNISLFIRGALDGSAIRVLMADEAQFIQNFLTVIGLLFSILAGNAYSALYEQQEQIYFALFQEVSEAKSLLEQTTLVGQGRPFYRSALACMRNYVKNDLRRLDIPPAELLSSRPMEDPLEAIMYMTSVGVPSVVYETVKNLRQARGYRLGAMQRKFPSLGIGLLYLLAAVELLAFPLLGAGSFDAAGQGILSLQSFLFACLCGAHMLVLRIIQELWQSTGGVFNVDDVLQRMVFGLEEELEMRSRSLREQPRGDTVAAAYGPEGRLWGADRASSGDGAQMVLQQYAADVEDVTGVVQVVEQQMPAVFDSPLAAAAEAEGVAEPQVVAARPSLLGRLLWPLRRRILARAVGAAIDGATPAAANAADAADAADAVSSRAGEPADSGAGAAGHASATVTTQQATDGEEPATGRHGGGLFGLGVALANRNRVRLPRAQRAMLARTGQSILRILIGS